MKMFKVTQINGYGETSDVFYISSQYIVSLEKQEKDNAYYVSFLRAGKNAYVRISKNVRTSRIICCTRVSITL